MSLIENYERVNPRSINPFNRPHRDFVPSGDVEADADYLARVAMGEISRFYVSLVEHCQRAGHYQAVVYDGYNGNTVHTDSAPALAYYGDRDSALLGALQAAIALAAEHGFDFLPDCAKVYTLIGREHLQMLERYAAGQAQPLAEEVL